VTANFTTPSFVMAGLVPAIHTHGAKHVIMDGRHKGGHDDIVLG
jgi:hypothetical protein